MPVSPSGGRRNQSILYGIKGIVDTLLLLGKEGDHCTEFIISMIKFGKGVLDIHVKIFNFCIDEFGEISG